MPVFGQLNKYVVTVFCFVLQGFKNPYFIKCVRLDTVTALTLKLF